MSIRFSCPNCFHKYKVKDSLAGQRRECKQCGEELIVPGGAAPREARTLVVRDEVRSRLVHLRVLWSDSREPVLDADRVADVEEAFGCTLPDEILALFACGTSLDAFDLSRIGSLIETANAMRCPRDLLPVGDGDGDGHVLQCISRNGPRDGPVGLTTFCEEDGSTSYASLPEWLDEQIESRVDLLGDDEGPLADRAPTPDEVSAFRPRLVLQD